MSPHKWRHFLFTWLKKQGIDDALIEPYSGHESRQSLEIYSRVSLADAQKEYDQVMGASPFSEKRREAAPVLSFISSVTLRLVTASVALPLPSLTEEHIACDTCILSPSLCCPGVRGPINERWKVEKSICRCSQQDVPVCPGRIPGPGDAKGLVRWWWRSWPSGLYQFRL